MSRLLTTALLAVLAAGAYCSYRGSCRRQRNQSPDKPSPAEPEHIQTWEDEGGGVPVSERKTAAQVEPRFPAPHSSAPLPSAQPPIQGATPSPTIPQTGPGGRPGGVPLGFGG